MGHLFLHDLGIVLPQLETDGLAFPGNALHGLFQGLHDHPRVVLPLVIEIEQRRGADAVDEIIQHFGANLVQGPLALVGGQPLAHFFAHEIVRRVGHFLYFLDGLFPFALVQAFENLFHLGVHYFVVVQIQTSHFFDH